MQHLDFSHIHTTEMRVSKPHLVESLARAALRKVPGARPLLHKHFRNDFVTQELKPPRIKPQKMYNGYGTQ